MYDILKKLFLWNNQAAVDAILHTYEQQQHCVISYIYFWPIVTHRVFASEANKDQKIYKQHLLESDFLLPDGIALQVFYFIACLVRRIKSSVFRLPNLNGTDFFPYFMNQVKKKYGADKINYIFYGVYDQRATTAQNQYGAAKAYGTKQNQFKSARIAAIKKHFGLEVDYYYESNFTDSSFSDFPFEDMQKHLKPAAINIVMNSRGVPRQEFWSHFNKEQIKKYRLLVFNQWATIDYLCGFEKRAPKLVIWMKLERLWRLITWWNKNIKKVKASFALFRYIFSYLLLKKRSR